ncbi:MAG: methylmalonyl-CoA mutase, N-terminal domain [Frankiaceae bacterium]|nr:methylmalonyl-CoA mutase, N-terminal domain [Frankiaceae bacterium]
MAHDAQPYRTRADLPAWVDEPGGQHPGTFPFVRGIHPQMYTQRLWRMRQYAGFGGPEETNARWRLLLDQGQHGVSCAFDLPTQIGYDSDDPRARNDAGRLGVAIDTLDDFVELFDGIPLGEISGTFNINASAVVVYAMLLETADRQGVDPASLTGTIANDPLIEFVARGLWRIPPGGALRLVGDVYEYSLRHTPKFYPVNLRGTLVYEAGGTAAQEIGFALACAKGYLDLLQERGCDMAEATARLSFLLFGDTNVLEEACKFRAARMLWAHLVRDRYGVESPHGQKMRFTVAIGNYNLRAQVPELNLVRNSLGALGGVLGGCQGMLVAGMDEAFEIPSEKASLLGLYTQQVIAHESKVTSVADPLGGSYYVESLTEQLRCEIAAVMDAVEDAGGAVGAIESGLLQRMVADSAYRVQAEEDSGERVVVGVNTPGAAAAEDPEFDLHTHDVAAVERKRRALAAFREGRDAALANKALGALRDALDGTDNVVDPVRAALRGGATLGEVMALCADRYGEYVEPVEA